MSSSKVISINFTFKLKKVNLAPSIELISLMLSTIVASDCDTIFYSLSLASNIVHGMNNLHMNLNLQLQALRCL